jgi:hypothetical protein
MDMSIISKIVIDSASDLIYNGMLLYARRVYRMKKRLNIYNLIMLLMGILAAKVLMIPESHTTSWLVNRDLITFIFCLIGIIIIGVLKYRSIEIPPLPDSSNEKKITGRAITISYQVNMSDIYRCSKKAFLYHPTFVVFQILISLVTTFILLLYPLLAHFFLAVLLASPLFLAATFFGWNCYFRLSAMREMQKCMQTRDTSHSTTSSLTEQGFRDITNTEENFHNWEDVISVHEHKGDIYFFISKGSCFIPRTAFNDIEDSKAYCQAAITLWKSNGAVWPDYTPKDIASV